MQQTYLIYKQAQNFKQRSQFFLLVQFNCQLSSVLLPHQKFSVSSFFQDITAKKFNKVQQQLLPVSTRFLVLCERLKKMYRTCSAGPMCVCWAWKCLLVNEWVCVVDWLDVWGAQWALSVFWHKGKCLSDYADDERQGRSQDSPTSQSQLHQLADLSGVLLPHYFSQMS